MESFYFDLGCLGIPLSLSSIGNRYVAKNWEENNYKGYQISSEILIGDASKIQTPIGIHQTGKTALNLSLYIGNYKGGRSESFMYGVDRESIWYDYDLTSAYTTILFKAGDPDYLSGGRLTPEELLKLSDKELLFSYLIIKCDFEFPVGIKYPSIPVYLDGSSCVYPRKGEGILTGAEYILARSQGCKLKIMDIYHIPFSKNDLPFQEIITDLQSKRRSHPPGSVSNLMYKEIGNSIYGSLVRGMSDKRKYDNKTGNVSRIPPHFLSNPIIASWVTAFIRAIIG